MSSLEVVLLGQGGSQGVMESLWVGSGMLSSLMMSIDCMVYSLAEFRLHMQDREVFRDRALVGSILVPKLDMHAVGLLQLGFQSQIRDISTCCTYSWIQWGSRDDNVYSNITKGSLQMRLH